MDYIPTSEEMKKFKTLVETNGLTYRYTQAKEAMKKNNGNTEDALKFIIESSNETKSSNEPTYLSGKDKDVHKPWDVVRHTLKESNKRTGEKTAALVEIISNEVQKVLQNKEINENAFLASLSTIQKVNCIAGIYLIVKIQNNKFPSYIDNLSELFGPVNFYINENKIAIPRSNVNGEVDAFYTTSPEAGISSIHNFLSRLGYDLKNMSISENNTELIENIIDFLKTYTNNEDDKVFFDLIELIRPSIIRETTFNIEDLVKFDDQKNGGKKTRKRKRIIRGKKSRKSRKGKKPRKGKKSRKNKRRTKRR